MKIWGVTSRTTKVGQNVAIYCHVCGLWKFPTMIVFTELLPCYERRQSQYRFQFQCLCYWANLISDIISVFRRIFRFFHIVIVSDLHVAWCGSHLNIPMLKGAPRDVRWNNFWVFLRSFFMGFMCFSEKKIIPSLTALSVGHCDSLWVQH
jgi:hypothetical protein